MRKIIWNAIAILMAIVFVQSCKKANLPDDDTEEIPPEQTDTKAELIKDSIYYYYNLYSLWTTDVPDYTTLREFSKNYNSNDAIFKALVAFTPYYANYETNIDRFSFLETLSDEDGNQSRLRMDKANGYGLYFGIALSSTTTANIVVMFVEGGSPAAKAGITRGNQVNSINGNTAVTIPVEYKDGSYHISDETTYNTVVNRLVAALDGGTLQLGVLRNDNTTETFSLQYSTYEIDPIIKDTVYVNTAKNIGYLAFSSFEQVTNQNQNYRNFEAIFNRFQQKNISDLILDMRYNTGGYVATAEYLANKVINSKGDKNKMFTYETNDYLSQFKTGSNASFADVYYSRDNTLELGTIYILATETTASAAELLINVLKPYHNVQIIAETDRTYGKPVGFFEQDILDSVALWAASFKTKNADGYTDYWDGLTADKANVVDRLGYDFGDPEEDMIATAIHHALTGNYTTSANRASTKSNPSTLSKLKLRTINRIPDKYLLKQKNESIK